MQYDKPKPMKDAPRDGSLYLAWCVETARCGFDLGWWAGLSPDDRLGRHRSRWGWIPVYWWPLPEKPLKPLVDNSVTMLEYHYDGGMEKKE